MRKHIARVLRRAANRLDPIHDNHFYNCTATTSNGNANYTVTFR